MGHQQFEVVFEAQELITVGADMGGELVLDALPGGDVGGVLVAVLPDGAPTGEDGGGGGGSDLVGGGEAAPQEAADH